MATKHMQPFWAAGILSAGLFLILFLVRMDVFERFFPGPKSVSMAAATRESWMSIYQNNRRIGFAHTRLSPQAAGCELQEKSLMRINSMGMVQDLHLRTRADLLSDLSLHRFDFEVASGQFRFSAQGADILRLNFDILQDEKDDQVRDKVRKGLMALGVDETHTLPYLLALLSVKDSGIDAIPMSPEARKDRIRESVKRIILKGSEVRPLVMAFEDLQWLDKATEELAKYTLDGIPTARVMLIFTSRPEYVHTWGGRSYHSQVSLNRLSNRESLAMAASILGTENIEWKLEELILEKTEGIRIAILLFFVMVGCKEHSESTKTVHSDTLPPDSIPPLTFEKMYLDFAKALNDKDAKTAILVYAEDASLVPPNESIITGIENIKTYWQGELDSGITDISISMSSEGSSIHLGNFSGRFKLSYHGPDGKMMVKKGKFVELLKQTADGKWVSYYGNWNLDLSISE